MHTIADGASPVQWATGWFASDLYTTKREVIESEIAAIE